MLVCVCLCAARCNNNLICAWVFILWWFDTLVPKPNVTSSSVREHPKRYVPNALHKHWIERQVCVRVCVEGLLEVTDGSSFRPLNLELLDLIKWTSLVGATCETATPAGETPEWCFWEVGTSVLGCWSRA